MNQRSETECRDPHRFGPWHLAEPHEANGVHFDRRSGHVGSGWTYGEFTYNGRPLFAGTLNDFGRTWTRKKAPFSPFAAPKPRV